jgi:hypothetical protein
MNSILSVQPATAAEYTTPTYRVNFKGVLVGLVLRLSYDLSNTQSQVCFIAWRARSAGARAAAQEASGATPIGLSRPPPSESVMPMRRELASSRPGNGSRK